jgi:hypothetical protein
MSGEFQYAVVIERQQKAIHVVRLLDRLIDPDEADELAAETREYLLAKRGEQDADVVIMQGKTKDDFRLFGISSSTARVRTALFHAALNWSPLDLD